jgi:selenocysteine lyase/cysteine desulfurase
LGKHLWEQYRIEVPIYPWNGNNQVRVSFQAYNTVEDSNHLVNALTALLSL